jgi:hypothetical protein
MSSPTKICVTLAVGILLTACQTAKSSLTKAEQAESAKIASTVPIADLHMHDGLGLSRDQETGVMWGGLGSKRGGRSTWMGTKRLFGDRLIAWAGQDEFNTAFFSGGISEMLNPDNFILARLYKQSEEDLRDGVIVGIGEIFINNRNSNPKSNFRRKGQVDALGIRKFFDLVAKYDGFLAFHMDADSSSMAELGKLLASNRKGRVVWNHCGSASSVSEMRSMLDKNSNLFCELSYRYPPINKQSSRNIFDSSGIHSSWCQLMEDHSDRFMVGTDAHDGDEFEAAIKTVRQGLLPSLKPATARRIAYQNAQRLFGFKDKPGS